MGGCWEALGALEMLLVCVGFAILDNVAWFFMADLHQSKGTSLAFWFLLYDLALSSHLPAFCSSQCTSYTGLGCTSLVCVKLCLAPQASDSRHLRSAKSYVAQLGLGPGWSCQLSSWTLCLCCDAAFCLMLEPLRAAASHTVALLPQSVPSLCSSSIQTPFILPCQVLQPAAFHLLSVCGKCPFKTCGWLHLCRSLRTRLQGDMSLLHLMWQQAPHRALHRPTLCQQWLWHPTGGKLLLSPGSLFLF